MFGARSLYPGSAELKVYAHEFLAFGRAAPFALKLPPEVLFADYSDGDDGRTAIRVRLAGSGMPSIFCRDRRKNWIGIEPIRRHDLRKPEHPEISTQTAFAAVLCGLPHLLEQVYDFGFIDRLPSSIQDAIAILLGGTWVQQLVSGRGIVNVAVGVARDEGLGVRRGFFDIQPDLHRQFAWKRGQHKIADAHCRYFNFDIAFARSCKVGLMLPEQVQICLHARELFHRLNVLDVRPDVASIVGVKFAKITSTLLLLVQVAMGVVRRKLVR